MTLLVEALEGKHVELVHSELFHAGLQFDNAQQFRATDPLLCTDPSTRTIREEPSRRFFTCRMPVTSLKPRTFVSTVVA